MMKRILLVMCALVLCGSAVYAQEALPEEGLDEITANGSSGSWVTENNLNLNDESQMEIQAVSNANAVDSAVAAQFNLDRLTMGTSPINNSVSNTNEATIDNYRPAHAFDLSILKTKSINVSESENESETSTRDFLGVFGNGSSESEEESGTIIGSSEWSITLTGRKSQAQKNAINLNSDSQRLIQAVSNLNAVASGAAVQTNIVSDMGVGGTITNVNTATVSNGF
jgi:phenylalanyl-tRNA synthetase beta subunit